MNTSVFAQKMLMFKDAILPKPVTDNMVETWNKRQPGYDKLLAEEKEFYYWVNYSRADPRRFFDSTIVPLAEIYPQLHGENFQSLSHDVKQSAPLPLLALNTALSEMAKAHALDIVSHDAKPSHNSTNGESFASRFQKLRLGRCGGENLSFGKPQPIFLVALLYLDINVPDLGHRKALLNPLYAETGIGAAFYQSGSIFVVEDFSCPQN
jgi:hypothetical protein